MPNEKISSLNKVQTKNRRSGHRYILSNIQISLVDFLQNRPFKTLGCERTTTATTTTTAAIWKQREKKNSRKLKTNRKEKQEISSPKRRKKKKHFWSGCDTQTYTHTGYNHISRAVVKGEWFIFFIFVLILPGKSNVIRTNRFCNLINWLNLLNDCQATKKKTIMMTLLNPIWWSTCGHRYTIQIHNRVLRKR